MEGSMTLVRRAAVRWVPYLLALVLMPLLPMQPGVFAQPAATPSSRELTAAQWREDLRFLAENLPKTHKNLFHTMAREEFEQAVHALDADIPNLDGYSIYIRLIQLCAMIQDGHSGLTRGASDVVPGALFLPVRFVRCADGIYIRGAAPEYAAAVGGKVVGIGPADGEEALRRMASVISHGCRFCISSPEGA